MDKSLFVTAQIAKQLRARGFDEPVQARYEKKDELIHNRLGFWYNHNSGEINEWYTSAPLIDQVLNWLESKHSIITYFTPIRKGEDPWHYDYCVIYGNVGLRQQWAEGENRTLTRRQAQFKAIKQALQRIPELEIKDKQTKQK